MEEVDVLEKKVAKWAKMLASEDKIEHALRRLERVQISLHLLSSTGVGKAVNALRKHAKWGDRAGGLVSRWREVAKAETARVAEESAREEDEDHDEDEPESEEEEDKQSYAPLVIRIKKGPKSTHSSSGYSSTSSPRYSPNDGDDRKRSLLEDDEDVPVDAFSAQLAAADRAPKTNFAKKPKKAPKISAESIQTSLMDSLNNPNFIPSQNNRQQHVFSDPNINMFKAPKEKRRIYAGKRKPVTPGALQQVPRLFDICIRFLISNIDAIDETGSIPFDVLRPVLEKANPEQLMRLERKNPYLREDTDCLWKANCEREFAKELTKLREELLEEDEDWDEDELGLGDGLSWRSRYKKFRFEREQRLKQLSSQIKSHINEVAQPQRQAMVTAPIAPRYVRKRQMQNGIRVLASQVPSAVELTRARRQIFETGNDADLRSMPAAIRSVGGSGQSSRRDYDNSSSSFSSLSATKKKPQRGPLMLKTLRMLKKQQKR